MALQSLTDAWSWYSAHQAQLNLLGVFLGGLSVAVAALRQASVAGRRHYAQTEADRQRRITESFSKAVEQLGSDKIEVRLGGIYTLERVSRESTEEYRTVIETLTAFIRQRTARNTSIGVETTAQSSLGPSIDIAAALTVVTLRKRPGLRSLRSRRIGLIPKGSLHRRGDGTYVIVRREDPESWRPSLRGSDLRGADLRGAHLERYDLSESNLESANLTSAHLDEAYLSGTNLKQAVLIKASLQRATLLDAQLEGADLLLANFSEAILQRSFLKGADLSEANLQGVDLFGSDLEGVSWGPISEEDEELGLLGYGVCTVQLKRARLSGTHLEKANFYKANLWRANLRDARLKGAFLNDAILKGADLSLADLRETNLFKANLRRATLWRAHLEGVDLTYVLGLAPKQLVEVFADADTVLPPGMARPSHWPPVNSSA